jgi:adhesin transport system membrane fusion protein
LRADKNSFGTAQCSAGLPDTEIKVVAPLLRDNIAPAARLLELKRQLE